VNTVLVVKRMVAKKGALLLFGLSLLLVSSQVQLRKLRYTSVQNIRAEVLALARVR
jgi:hypothetical protein